MHLVLHLLKKILREFLGDVLVEFWDFIRDVLNEKNWRREWTTLEGRGSFPK